MGFWNVPVINAFDFQGVDPTGTNDSTVGLQNALNAAAGGILMIPQGVYLINLGVHPENGTFHPGLIIWGNTILTGAGRDVTIIRLAPNQVQGNDISGSNMMLINRHITAGGDINIVIQDLTLDGNGANQAHTFTGIALQRAQATRHERVKVMNCRGTAQSGTNETFAFGNSLGFDHTYYSCLAQGSAGSTASGFSCSSNTDIKYIDCYATGMSVNNGFTHNTCRNVEYTNCHSFLNANAGFNSEVSANVTYTGCTAGGLSTAANGVPYSSGTSLGNLNGFIANSASGIINYNACESSYNASGTGLNVVTSSRVIVRGGSYINNNFGIGCDVSSAALSSIDSGPIFVGTGLTNTTANFAITGGFRVFAWPAPPPLPMTPAVPATGVAAANPFPFEVNVYVTGGTVTNIQVNGANTGLIAGAFRINPGGTIAWVGSAAPTWIWSG